MLKVIFRVLLYAFPLAVLYLSKLYNYLLFHSLVELFGSAVAVGIFMVAWNSRRIIDNGFFLFIGISYLFVGSVGFLHTLAYEGMGVFPGGGADLPTQLWLAARYPEAASFLLAPLFIGRRVAPTPVITLYSVATALLLMSIFVWRVFPACYVEGAGLTPFKIASEYVISLALAAAAAILYAKRKEFDPGVFRLVEASIATTILAELSFTLYTDVYGTMNLLGHFFMIASFYLLYKAFIETGLMKPYTVLFRNLDMEKDRARNYLDVAGVIMVAIGADQRVLLINRKGCEVLGYSEDEIVGRNWFDNFLPKRLREDVKKVFSSLISGDISLAEYFENPVLTRSGEERIIAWHNTVLRDAKGDIVATLGSGEDITERRRAEDELRALVQEKEMLVRESHHRVKNNLTVISSLLRLQSGGVEDEKARGFITESRSRVQAMSLIHEKLYRSADMKTINFREYASDLVARLFRTYDTGGGAVRLETEIGDVALDVDTVIPCGLILNELVSNALKYAFPDGRDGQVTVGFKLSGDGMYCLAVRDDGVGFPEDLDFRSAPTMGMQIVNSLAAQLNGDIELRREGGTEFRVTFHEMKFSGNAEKNEGIPASPI